MNNRELKRALKTICRPPEAERKEEFLDRIETSRLSAAQFLISYIGFIRPWGWVLSALIFITALRLMWELRTKPEDIWTVSALLPFAALSAIAELNRSARYKMEELELASRFSLKFVMLARMELMGLGNLLLLTALSPFAVWWGHLTLVEIGFYILCPYCMTTWINLIIVRHWRCAENLYACAVAAGGVSLLCYATYRWSYLARDISPAGYGWITVILVALMILEYKKYLSKREEECTWN